jgi:hypothetical protein
VLERQHPRPAACEPGITYSVHTLTNPLATGSYPSADTPIVVRVRRAEVALLTRDDTAVDDRDRHRQRGERPRRIRDDRDPGIRVRQAEVAGIPSQPLRAVGNDRLRRRVRVNGVRARPKARTTVPISPAPATINAAPTGRQRVMEARRLLPRRRERSRARARPDGSPAAVRSHPRYLGVGQAPGRY